MAVESARVTADVIEANEFPELSDQFSVSGVPKIVINDRVELIGSQREAKFIEAILAAAGVVEAPGEQATPD
jgi:hypothetical protein